MENHELSGESLLREIFFERLESNPALSTSEVVSFFEKCTAIKTMREVWERQAICIKMMSAYPDGHPSQAQWLDEFVAFRHYEEHLNDLEAYRAELAAERTPACL